MQTVVGIFTSQAAAEQATEQLCRLGIARDQIHFLVPGASLAQAERVPTSETEQPGMGTALGGVVGGAVGASSGMMTATVLTALIPGIGTVTAIGLAALSLLGLVGGAVAGAVAGGALEDSLANGLPKDELYIYKDALRRGRTVLIALIEDADQATAARAALAQAGTESLDAARAQWWVGTRDAEAEAYHATGGDFAKDEAVYRRGFEAALRTEIASKPYQEADADVSDTEAYRRGYERGRAYLRGLTSKSQP
jgi:outer membrane lipoprotein SlyB